MKKKVPYYYQGIVHGYIELLKTGIRDVCIPSYGVFNKSEIDFIDKEAKKAAFKTLLVTFNRIGNKGNKFKSYQRIIYAKEAREKALKIRKAIVKRNKTKTDTARLGKLFGYSKDKIDKFINKKKS